MEYAIADLKNVSYGSEWSITARVLTKSNIIPYASGKTEKRFTTILFDKTTEISATAFDQDAVRLFSQLEENNVYNIKNGEVIDLDFDFEEDKKNMSNNDYEIIFNGSTKIELTGVTDIPIHPQLKTIENVFSMEIHTFIDTIGVIIQKLETGTYKIITLADSTSRVNVRLFDKCDKDFNTNIGDVMSIIRGEIGSINNIKEIWVDGLSKIVINPDWKVHITSYLQSWYNEDLNPSQVSIGSEELNTLKYLSQSFATKPN